MTAEDILFALEKEEIDKNKAITLLDNMGRENAINIIDKQLERIRHGTTWKTEEIDDDIANFEREKEKINRYINLIKQRKRETEKCIFLELLHEDSPGTYKAIIKLIELNRVQITQDNKLNFISMKKGTVAHIYKEGGYTEWYRVMQFTLIDGKEDTGSLKTLAANDPPIEYEKIKKDIYQN